MDDENESLRGALESAFDAADASSATETAEPVVAAVAEAGTPEPTAAQRARDESGRFSKTPAEVAAEKAPIAESAAVATAADAAASGAKAPSSWKKEAAAVWEKVETGQPLTQAEAKIFRDEAARREQDFHKGIDTWKGHAQVGNAYEKALAPYQDTLRTLGVDGVTAVTELMKADHILRHAPPTVKVQKLIELANVYGIDLQQQFSPDTARYEKELFDTREQLRTIQSQTQESTHASLNSDIERFKAAPGHEHFDAVREHMAALLTGGLAKDLDEAYSQAVYANPQTRTSLLDQQRKQAAVEAQALKARAASGSVRGSSPASGNSSAPPATIRGAVEAAFDQHS